MFLDFAPADIALAAAGDASGGLDGTRTFPLSPAAIAAAETVALASSAAALLRVLRREEVVQAEALQADAARLAVRTVRHVVEGAPDAATLEAEAARVREAEASLTGEAGEQVRAIIGSGPLLMASARPHLHRAALEELGAGATLVPDESESPVLTLVPTTPGRLRVLLADDAIGRALEWAMADPVASADMSAAKWYFEGWSDPRIRGGGAEAAREVRKEEWLALERRSVAFGQPILAEMEERGATAGWGERTRAAAAALARSETGVFRVVEQREEGGCVVEERASGEQFTVRDGRVALEPGWTLVGRLIPLDDGAYALSAGTAVVPVRRRTARVDAARMKELPRVLAMEVYLSLVLHGDHRRQRVLPADGPAEAQLRLVHAYEVLNGPLDPQPLPSSGIVIGSPDGSRRGASPKLDHVMAEWLQALMEMAKKSARLDRSKRKKAKKRGRR